MLIFKGEMSEDNDIIRTTVKKNNFIVIIHYYNYKFTTNFKMPIIHCVASKIKPTTALQPKSLYPKCYSTKP